MSLFDKLNGAQQINMQQLQSDPVGMAKKAGFNIPDNIAGDPQAMVRHLIQSGQVSSPMLQKIMPMIQKLGGIK